MMLKDKERIEILDRLASGEIDAAEAASLLAAPEKVAVLIEPVVAEIEELKVVEKEMVAVVAETAVPFPPSQPSEPSEPDDSIEPKKPSDENAPSWFKVRVKNLDNGKNKVSVNIPLGMFKFGLNIARRLSSNVAELDLDGAAEMLRSGYKGMIVEVQDEESNEHVQVYLD